MPCENLAPEPAIRICLATATDASGIASLLADSFGEYRLLYTLEGFEATAISAAEVADRLKRKSAREGTRTVRRRARFG